MTNDKHLNILKQGVDAWNEWRGQYPDSPDLRQANLSGANLTKANLERANLSGANLRGANLGGSILREANLREADLREARIRGSNLSDATLSALLTRFGFEVLEIESWIPDSFVHLAETDPHFAEFLFHPNTQEFFRGGAYGDYITCFARNQPAARQAWRLAGWDSSVNALRAENERLRAEAEDFRGRIESIYSRSLVRAYRWLKLVLRGGR